MMRCTGIVALALFFGLGSPLEAQEPTVGYESLLREMLDREALARYPDPSYTCRQFSSYDPASVSPEESDTWFANGDRGHYLRVEEVGDRKEYVMMDADGPGAVVRIWSANPAGVMRVYVDGAVEPVLSGEMTELLGGGGAIGQPLSAQRSRGWNLYLPIPYAKHVKITSDAGDFYYQINYRTYAEGTVVESFAADSLEKAGDLLEKVQKELVEADTTLLEKPLGPVEVLVAPGGRGEVKLPPGPRALKSITMRLYAEDVEQALRTTVLSIAFDGEETVWCPVGDFFGSGAGVAANRDWWRTVRENGCMVCRWVMPYRETVDVRVLNFGKTEVTAHLAFEATSEWEWDDRSMHFHATWRQENPIHTRPMHDWNYVEIEGKGVFVGDNLAVANPNTTWWGEGDEKIWVDDEEFPSHFGTGTEDYYGYAWCCNESFFAPFHNQPRCDGPGNYGHTLVSRVRALDAIPFEKHFKFDMEVWHWKECDEGYAATTYFYALPGSTNNREPLPEEATRGLLDPPPLPPPFRVEGAVECEGLEIVGRSEGITIGPQGGFESVWSGDKHLWVQGQQVGDFVELAIPVEGEGPVKLEVFATRSWDYGIVLFSVNGESTGLGVDLFNRVERKVDSTGPRELGEFTAVDGELVLRAEVVGGNPASEGTRAYFGLDCVRLTPAGE